MSKILGHCCYLEFQTLRKTCHHLLDTISNYKGDPKFESISVNIQSCNFRTNSIILTLHFHDDHPSVDLNYITDQRGCWMEKKVHSLHGKTVKFLEDRDFRDVFYGDLDRLVEVLKFPKTMLHRFTLIVGPHDYGFFEKLKVSNLVNLKIEILSLMVTKFRNVFEFLPFLSPEHLKTLKIEGGKIEELGLEEIEKLKKWNHLEDVEIRGFYVEDPRRLLEFKKITVDVLKVPLEVLREMKEKFRTSSNFISCKLNYICRIENDMELVHALGNCFLAYRDDFGRQRKRWFWTTSDSRKILYIESIDGKNVIFSTLELEEVPDNVFVLE